MPQQSAPFYRNVNGSRCSYLRRSASCSAFTHPIHTAHDPCGALVRETWSQRSSERGNGAVRCVPRCPLPDERSLTLFAWECNVRASQESPYTDTYGNGMLQFRVVWWRQSAGIIALNRTMRRRNDFLVGLFTMARRARQADVQKWWKNER